MSLPTQAPGQTYRFDQSFEWNFVNGPQFTAPFPPVPQTPMKTFLGLPVRSRLGVPASILSTSRWLETYARLGFDVLTFKTVRSIARLCGSPPNWLYLDEADLARHLADPDAPLHAVDQPTPGCGLTLAGSFGMPSAPPSFWQPDLERACRSIGDGQVVIGSIVGTAGEGVSDQAFIADFDRLTRQVCEAGVHAVEANLSCPNVGRAEGELYQDSERSGQIAQAVRAASGGRPVLLKTGPFASPQAMRGFLQRVNGHADAVVMINAPARRIVRADGSPAFPPGRERAGVIGARILPIALDAVRTARQLIAADHLALQVIGAGGLTTPADARAFLDAGACAAQSATGAMFNPYLAIQTKHADPSI